MNRLFRGAKLKPEIFSTIRALGALRVLLVLAGCATVSSLRLDERFGSANPAQFDQLPVRAVANAPDYWQEVRPLLDQRCVSCHSCYDAPCQLNLASYAGLTRGAKGEKVYDSNRLLAAKPSRLGIDAQTNQEWRRLGFFPVLNERMQTPEANRIGSVMYRLLDMKQQQGFPEGGTADDPDIDFSLDRAEACPQVEEMDAYRVAHPGRGMPFGLPALTPQEHKTLSRWIEAGAPYTPPAPLPANVLGQVRDWERFMNGGSLKEQLAARYIFEHWFAGHFFFGELPGHYFQWVRSRSAPGQPIDLVATRRPYDDPGVARVYYRLQRMDTTPVAKTHMPLRLDAARMVRLRGWFLSADYTVDTLPGYQPEVAANPFVAFRSLPVDSRYRFMLDEAQFIMMGFMKGAVCRGQVALNVINDHFWVIFVAPEGREVSLMGALIDGAMPNLRLPAEHQSTTGLLAWRDYAVLEQRYLAHKSALLASLASRDLLPSTEALWNGEGRNTNDALTIFRHFDSASVVRGLVGERPQTTLLLGYPLFERMHYLLAAGFDVYGNVGHQLATRLYMDFLRMEGELNFLTLLPIKERQKVLNYWYRGREIPQSKYFADAAAYFPQEPATRFKTQDVLGELYSAIRRRVVRPSPAQSVDAEFRRESAVLQQLSAVRGIAASRMPEQSLLMIERPDGSQRLVSLVRNSAHSNVAQLFAEEERRLPQEDTLLALDGVVGAYPNAFFAVDSKNLANFKDDVAGLADASGISALTDRYGIRRTDRRFWPFSDRVHAEWRRIDPVDAAILDYSRFENL